MSFFDVLKKKLGLDDETSQETGGVIDGNDIHYDNNSGNILATPKIPKIILSPTASEKYQKSSDFLSGKRGIASDVTQSPQTTNVASGTTQPDNVTANTSTIGDPYNAIDRSNVDALANANKTNQGQSTPSSILSSMMNKPTLSQSSSDISSANNDVNVPAPPTMESAPDKSDKRYNKEGKFKDILFGITQRMANVDLSKVPPQERTSAFLGAIAGGAIAGAGHKSKDGMGLLGEARYGRDEAEVNAQNEQRQKDYKTVLENTNQQVLINNNKIKPVLDSERIANKKAVDDLNASIRQQQVDGKVSKDQADFRIKMLQIGQKDEQFKTKLSQFKTYRTTQNADGTFGITGIRGDGTSEKLQYADGSYITAPDPSAWAKTLEDIKATGDVAATSVAPVSPQERSSRIETQAAQMAGGQEAYDALPETAKANKPSKAKFRQQVAGQVDKQIDDEQKQAQAKAKASAVKGAINNSKRNTKTTSRPSAPSSVMNNLKGIDFSTQFKNRQR